MAVTKKNKKLAKEIIAPKSFGNHSIKLKSFVYHLCPDMYDCLAGNKGPKANPVKGAHKRRSQYDNVVMEVINNHFGLIRTVDKLVIR